MSQSRVVSVGAAEPVYPAEQARTYLPGVHRRTVGAESLWLVIGHHTGPAD